MASLINYGDYEKAVKILLKIGSVEKAIELCLTKDIPITEEMADLMAPTTLHHNSATGNNERTLLSVAKACKKQGSFHLAAKKYSEAGFREKAVKSLIKARDIEKCILFASNLK